MRQKRPLRMASVHGAAVVRVDDLLRLLGDFMADSLKQGEALDEELRKNWHWSGEVEEGEAIHVALVGGRAAAFKAVGDCLIAAEDDAVDAGEKGSWWKGELVKRGRCPVSGKLTASVRPGT